jgi:hypothetical protein
MKHLAVSDYDNILSILSCKLLTGTLNFFQSMIKLTNAHKYFGERENRLHVLKGIDLEIQKGDLIARTQLFPDMEHLSAAESRLESARINLKKALS